MIRNKKGHTTRRSGKVARAISEAEAVKPAAPQQADKRITQRALELLRQDSELDDEKFTPPGAVSLVIDAPRPSPEPQDKRRAR